MTTKIMLSRVIAVFLIAAVAALSSSAQLGPSLSRKTEAIKRKVDSLAPHAPISVIPVQGPEQFGEFLSKDQEGFTFRDVDRNIDVTCKYSEVRKVKDGYGGYNSAQGRHTDHTKGIVVGAIVIDALGALIGAAAAARD
jgi:hypothetical protein